MKKTTEAVVPLVLGLGLLFAGCSKKHSAEWKSLKNPEIVAQLRTFVAEKEAQANAATVASGESTLPEYKRFFAAAEKGDWPALNKAFEELKMQAPQYEHPPGSKIDERLRGKQWAAVAETWGAFDAFGEGDEKYSAAFGNDIIASIPPGSIYFGGTDPGRFLVTALQKSHVGGDPFFTLTQNALADMSYLDYLRSIYGDKINIPTPEDSQNCFQEYTEAAQQRLKSNKLKRGENVQVNAANGRIQVSGQAAVMEINGLLVKTILEKNPGREFYIEESWPLGEWLYPHLEPHGLIMKINRQPSSQLSEEITRPDHDYWTKYIQPMIGEWLKNDTSVETIKSYAERVFLRHDFAGFTGDPKFVQNDYSCKMFSKLRSSMAGVYVWRMNQAATAIEKERMAREADFAYRQALALCPYLPEAAGGYADFLRSQNRDSDATLISEMAERFPKQK